MSQIGATIVMYAKNAQSGSWELGKISDMGHSGAIWARLPSKRSREYCVCKEAEKEAKFGCDYHIIEKPLN